MERSGGNVAVPVEETRVSTHVLCFLLDESFAIEMERYGESENKDNIGWSATRKYETDFIRGGTRLACSHRILLKVVVLFGENGRNPFSSCLFEHFKRKLTRIVII